MTVKLHAYALELQVGNATAKLILAGIAEDAKEDGTAAFPTKETLGRYGECSVATVKRHLVYLQKRGYIRRGDQRYVQHLRADRRPTVWDIAIDTATRQQWATEYATQGERGLKMSPRERGVKMSPRDETAGHTGAQNERGLKMNPRKALSKASDRRGAPLIDIKNPPPPPEEVRPRAGRAYAPARERAGEAEEEVKISKSEPPPVGAVADTETVAFVADLPGSLTHRQRATLATLTAPLLSAGWAPAELRRELVVDADSARSRYAVYVHRAESLAAWPVPAPPPAADRATPKRPRHPFTPGPDGIACTTCGTPERNASHSPAEVAT